MGLPILVALVSIPLLIGLLGEARFGVLTIAWLVFGYFSLFDMGLHRALTQMVSKALGASQYDRITGLFWTSLFLMATAGVVGAVIVWFTAPHIVQSLKIPGELTRTMQDQIQLETLYAFMLMAVGLPVLSSSAGLRGMLEAHQKFSSIAMIQLWHGAWTFLGPLFVAWFLKPDLAWIVGGLLVGRLITWLAYFILATKAAPQVWDRVRIDRSAIKPLLYFGGWMTLTNAVVPIVLYGDRFIIGTIIDTEAVAHYVTPAEIVFKLLIIPNAILGVLFPAFAMTFDSDRKRTKELFVHGIQGSLLVLLPVVIGVVALAPELLSIWLRIGMNNADALDFAEISSPVLQLLAIGVLINGLALIPTALVQSCGKPSWIAILYCVELPLWYFSMVWLTSRYGVLGTAVAWGARQVFDLVVVLILSRKLMGGDPLNLQRSVALLTVTSMSLLSLTTIDSLTLRVLSAVFLMGVTLWVGWQYVIDSQQRHYALGFLEKYRPAKG